MQKWHNEDYISEEDIVEFLTEHECLYNNRHPYINTCRRRWLTFVKTGNLALRNWKYHQWESDTKFEQSTQEQITLPCNRWETFNWFKPADREYNRGYAQFTNSSPALPINHRPPWAITIKPALLNIMGPFFPSSVVPTKDVTAYATPTGIADAVIYAIWGTAIHTEITVTGCTLLLSRSVLNALLKVFSVLFGGFGFQAGWFP